VVSLGAVGVPCFDECLALGVGGGVDAIADGCGSAQAQEGEPLAELLELILDLLFTDAFLGKMRL